MYASQGAPRPTSPPPAASKTQLKYEICQAVQGLLAKGAPAAWQGWTATQAQEFMQAVHGCHTGRSLTQLDTSARLVCKAYGEDLQQMLAARGVA